MIPLFKQPEKEEVDRTAIAKYNTLLQKIGYRILLDPKKPFESKSEIIGIQNVKTGKYILTMYWLRPSAWTIKGIEKSLDDYPRLSIPPHLHAREKHVKVEETIQCMTEWNMYFLVILPHKSQGKIKPMFWVDRYDSIPLECWKLNWWKTKNVATRLLLQNFYDYKFVELERLKVKLDKIFETL